MTRSEYPICPLCGSRVAAALMTSGAIRDIAVSNSASPWYKDLYYHADALSIYCTSANCNYDMPLANLKTPIPKD
jgi:hypothetical protein